MRFGLGRNSHITADVTFYGLVVLTSGLLVTLAGFVSYFAPIYDMCKSVWGNLILRASSPGVLVPIMVGGSIVVVAGLTLVRQWRATRRLLRGLAPYHTSVPSRLARIAREVGLEDRIDCISGIITAPFCHGFIRPRVCIPVTLLDMLNDSELRAVLRHEGYHARSRDPFKVWLSRALARGLFFLPLAGDLRDSYLAAKEIAADETTAQSDELSLASALVKILSAGKQGLKPAPLTLSLAGGSILSSAEMSAMSSAEGIGAGLSNVSVAGLVSVTRVPSNETEERIRRLIDGRPAQLRLPSVTSVVLSTMIVLAIFAASYTNLKATSVVPESQECATEHMLRRSEAVLQWPFDRARNTALTVEWPAVSLEMNAASVVQPVAGPGAISSRFNCDLLTPTCQ